MASADLTMLLLMNISINNDIFFPKIKYNLLSIILLMTGYMAIPERKKEKKKPTLF